MQFPYVVSPLIIDHVILGLFSVWKTARAYSTRLRERAPSRSRNRWWRLLDISPDVSWWTPHETAALRTVDSLIFGIETIKAHDRGCGTNKSQGFITVNPPWLVAPGKAPSNYFSL